MTTTIPATLLIDDYVHAHVRVLTDDGPLEGELVGVTTDHGGNVCITLANRQNKADPDFTFVDGDDIVRIEVPGQLGVVVVYSRDAYDHGDPYAFAPLDDPAAQRAIANGTVAEQVGVPKDIARYLGLADGEQEPYDLNPSDDDAPEFDGTDQVEP